MKTHSFEVPARRVITRRQFVRLAAAGATVGAAGGLFRLAAPAAAAHLGLAPAVALPGNTVAGMAAALGHDLERIFRFVQREIRYEPYAGVLRGAQGTLLSRSGNSDDQALLLAELLGASSVSVRFVSGQLDAGRIDALMAATVTESGAASRQTVRALFSDDDLRAGVSWPVRPASQPEGPPRLPDLQALHDAFRRDVRVLAPAAATWLKGTMTTLAGALEAAGVRVSAGLTRMPDLERTSHTWVQANTGTAWLDLDASFENLNPGQAAASPGAPADAIGDQRRHRVTIAVRAESLVRGTLTQSTLLTASGFVDEWTRASMLLGHASPDRLPGIGLLGAEGDVKRYHPVLYIGGEAYVGRRPIVIATGAAANFADALGGGDDEGLVEGEASAEWVDVTVTAPGATPATARRAIFDRIGLAARAEPRLDPAQVPKATLVDLRDGAGAHFLPCRSLRAFVVSGHTLNLKAIIESLDADGPPPMTLLAAAYEALRSLCAAELTGSIGCRPFSDTASISSWVTDATPDGFVFGLDILHRSVGTLGTSDGQPMAAPPMVAGALAHAVERFALGDGISGEAGSRLCVSVGTIFEKAAAAGIPVKVFKGALPAASAYDKEHRARIELALKAGMVVAAPERAVVHGNRPRLGWWLIDPVTGAMADEMDDGRGETGDYVVVNNASSVYTRQGLQEYGWSVMNQGLKYMERRGPNQAVSSAMSRLWEALMALRPPGPLP